MLIKAKNCIICKSDKINDISHYRNKNTIFNNLYLSKCRNCGMVFANPMPSKENISEYNENYFNNAHGTQPRKKIIQAYHRGIAKIRYSYISQYLNKYNIHVEKILEIGPGPGFFAENWIKNKNQIKYFAIESDDSCYNSLTNLGVSIIDNKILDDCDFFDIVILSHVLEHNSEPDKFLINYIRKLKRGGVLFIEVPCQDYKHKSIDEPHILFFDKKPMEILMQNIGFEKIKVSYHGKTIQVLSKESKLYFKIMALRSKLISLGIVRPFALTDSGIEYIVSPLERAAVFPFHAHIEHKEPAWWLRAIAIKK